MRVAGLQLTYTMRSGPVAHAASIKARSSPLRGGSTTMTSGWMPSSFQRGMIFSAAPVSKCTFVTPFNFAHIKLFPEIDGNRLKCLLWHLLPCAHEGKDDLDQPERYEDVDLEEPPRLEVLAFLDSPAVAIDTAL